MQKRSLIIIQNFALYFYCFSLHFEFWDPLNTGIDFIVSKFSITLYLFVLIFNYKKFIRINNITSFLKPLIILFILQTTVSLIYQNELYSNYFDFVFFLNIALFLIVINHHQYHWRSLKNSLLAFALGGVLVSYFYLFGFQVDIQDDLMLEGRSSLFGDNQNTIGVRLVFSLFIIITYLLKNKLSEWSPFTLGLTFSVPIILNLLSATGSRVAIISFFLGLFILVIFHRTSKLTNGILKWFFGTLLILCLLFYFSTNKIFSERLINFAIASDNSGRDVIWALLFELISENPFFGQGLTGYSYSSYQIFGSVASPHNAIIETICYTGLVGLIFFVMFLFRIIKQAFTSLNESDLLPVLLLIPILGVVFSGQVFYPKYIWLMLASIVSSKLLIFNKA